MMASYTPTPKLSKRLLECPPAPCKLDFSKMKKRPVSERFIFPKSTEQTLAEALAEIEALKKQVAQKDVTISEMDKEISRLNEIKDDYDDAITEYKEIIDADHEDIEALKKKCKDNDKELLDYMNEKTAVIAELLGENIELKNRVNDLTNKILNPFQRKPHPTF
jgi:chromosome segregation ATPase